MERPFRFDEKKAACAIAYLASKPLKEPTKYSFCKLLFFADKKHLVQFARPVIGDSYFAMEHGPVPSTVLNLLNSFINGFESEFSLELKTFVNLNREFKNPRFVHHCVPEMNGFSETEIEVLDWAAENFGKMNFTQLKAITHETLAYRNAWENRQNKQSVPMDYRDFFEEDDPDVIAGALDQMLENEAISRTFEPANF